MNGPLSPVPDEIPVYNLTKDGLVRQEEPIQPAAPRQRKGSPWLWAALFLAALAYFLDAGAWLKAAQRYVDARQQHLALAPYRAWALQHPLSYEDVSFNPGVWAGKAVLWDISLAPDGSFCFGADAARKISWAPSAAPESSKIPQSGAVVKVLARVESSEDQVPQLAFLETL